MDSQEDYFIVDSNGEVIKSIKNPNNYIQLEEGDRVLRHSSKKYLQDTEKIKYGFVKVNINHISEVSDIAPIVFKLLPYIRFSSNLLLYDNYVYVSPRNFAMVTDKSLSTVRRQFQKLEKYDVIKKVPVGKNKYAYYFNPYIACRSTRVEIDTLNLFCKSKYVRSGK